MFGNKLFVGNLGEREAFGIYINWNSNAADVTVFFSNWGNTGPWVIQ